MSIIAYRDPLDALSDGAFSTDGVNLYYTVNGAQYQLVQGEQIAKQNELIALLVRELTLNGWAVQSQRLLDLLDTSISNNIQP